MPNIDKIVGGMFALIALYLFLVNYKGAAAVIGSGGGFIQNETALLQGRNAGGAGGGGINLTGFGGSVYA